MYLNGCRRPNWIMEIPEVLIRSRIIPATSYPVRRFGYFVLRRM